MKKGKAPTTFSEEGRFTKKIAALSPTLPLSAFIFLSQRSDWRNGNRMGVGFLLWKFLRLSTVNPEEKKPQESSERKGWKGKGMKQRCFQHPVLLLSLSFKVLQSQTILQEKAGIDDWKEQSQTILQEKAGIDDWKEATRIQFNCLQFSTSHFLCQPPLNCCCKIIWEDRGMEKKNRKQKKKERERENWKRKGENLRVKMKHSSQMLPFRNRRKQLWESETLRSSRKNLTPQFGDTVKTGMGVIKTVCN